MHSNSNKAVLEINGKESSDQALVSVALVGNPNTGKSTLFNRLTGSRQRVGNYPGVTVEKREGKMILAEKIVTVVDLPGAYSLSASSVDERVVVDFLSGNISGISRPSLVVCVLDATNLTRNLFLASQVSDTGCPLILVLNMSDEVEAQGASIDYRKLSQRLGVPVVPTVATKGVGVKELQQEIARALTSPRLMKRVDWPQPVTNGLAQLRQKLEPNVSGTVSDAELQRLLFDHKSAVIERVGIGQQQMKFLVEPIRKQISKETGIDSAEIEPLLRYEWLSQKTSGVVEYNHKEQTRFSDKLDAVLTHRVFGLLVFLGVMYLVFQSIYAFAEPFMDFIEETFGALGEALGEHLESAPMLESLVVDGIIAGVGGVVIFLPQILILFLFIAILEDSGYMARAAFLMDKVFGWCGLNGKSFVPLLSSYACAIPGVMAARTIEDSRSRLVTILIAPLMSCSARLPVYVLLIGAFIEPTWGPAWAGFTLFVMHFVGLFVAIPVAYVLNRFLSRKEAMPFILEMPPYRFPQLRDVLWRMLDRGKQFLKRAGTMIFCMSIIVWALCYFPHSQEVADNAKERFIAGLAVQQGISESAAWERLSDEETAQALERAIAAAQMEQSYMGRFGKFVQPVFAPAGFDWKITVGVLASFPAREVIIATLGIIYNLGGDVDEASSELVMAMQSSTWSDGTGVFSPLVAIGVMVFFALCMQCGATVAVIARETTWAWAGFAFMYMTVLAWLGAVLVYQIGSLI